jgi:hypothetical protein
LAIIALVVTGAVEANAAGVLIYGVNNQLNELVSFNSTTPGTLIEALAITGLQPNEQVRGIFWTNGTLYCLGGSSRLYTINPSTGAATHIDIQFNPLLNGVYFGFTGSPNQLYEVSDLGQNLAINPLTGAATAGPNYTGASISAMAYDPLNTTFYGISAVSHDLYTLNPATGSTTLVGSAGVSFVGGIGFAISQSGGYFCGTVGGQAEFFMVNLSTGALSLIGDVGAPGVFTGLNCITVAGP